ncbi:MULTISPECIES: hypothetical protein [unclassified Helicobacter]|uniref:hypothetical protein n=1 Tax=unclassified Helicobacter TaxID=2593540 RepID=UPI000CF19301|nr:MULTISPECIES: hypothetical protein [unclassified Helicobacter]
MRLFVLGILLISICFGGEKVLIGGNGGLLPLGKSQDNWNAGFFVGFDSQKIEEEDIAITSRIGLLYTYGNLGFGSAKMRYHSVDIILDAIFGKKNKGQSRNFFEYLGGIGGGYSYNQAIDFRNYHAGNILLRLGLVFNLTDFLELSSIFTTRFVLNSFGDGDLNHASFFINRVAIQVYEKGLWMILPELSLNLNFKFKSPF